MIPNQLNMHVQKPPENIPRSTPRPVLRTGPTHKATGAPPPGTMVNK